jgi:hypothetical protein
MPWLGKKKLMFVPLYRPHAYPPDQIPDQWWQQIERRVFYDPDPRTGADRSLRTYIHTVSSGRADLDADIWSMQTLDQQDVPPNALDNAAGPFGYTLGNWFRHEGYDAAALVMLGGPGAGTSAGYWVRFVMAEGVGVWAMEFMHSLTGFGDLYPFGGNMGSFDEMACSCGTHPSAYTKRAIQWLDSPSIASLELHNQGFNLSAVGLIQPPPNSHQTAVQIGADVPYYMVEARKKVDQFDAGIPSEGVIVYRVQTTDPLGHAQNQTAPLELVTPVALTPGQSFITDTNVSVSVTGEVPGGFLVIINDRNVEIKSGELLFYRDTTQNGTGDVNTPALIGLGGWQQFTKLFSDGNGAIYAINPLGQLLFYRDYTRNGTGDVNTPSVIGQGGWQNMKFVFSGGPGIIYAVNQQGQLLFYRDTTQNGTGDVNTPAVIGQGGWQQFLHLFYGGNGIIYAVDQQGRLLFYRDTTQNGTGDVNTPSVIGQGGWQQFRHLFGGGNGIIYAVNQQGQLLFYRDTTQNGTGDVNTPSVIGQGGWQVMKFLFSGGSGIIYAVPA